MSLNFRLIALRKVGYFLLIGAEVADRFPDEGSEENDSEQYEEKGRRRRKKEVVVVVVVERGEEEEERSSRRGKTHLTLMHELDVEWKRK
jgi:hypothetical protein